MRTFDDMLSNQLKDEEFRKEYEAIQPEMDVIRAIVDARTSQNLTQKELAERTGINQADISKLENGTRNPSVNLLKRLADGMGMALKIEFVPKQQASSCVLTGFCLVRLFYQVILMYDEKDYLIK